MKRVLIVSSGLLLTSGVDSLLSREADLDIRSLEVDGHNEDTLITQIARFKPEVVVLDGSWKSHQLSRLLAELRDCRKFRVIVIDGKENLMHIFDKQVVEVSRGGDLVTAIRRAQSLS